MGVIKAAIADGLLTFLWVFCSSNIGVSTYFIASYFGIVNEIPSLFITTLIVFVIFLMFDFLGDVLGGAGFNPTGNAAFYAAGLGDDSLVSAAVRCPAQVAGAVAGSLALVELIPKHYHHMLDGPALKVDVQTGAIAEGVLTFVITFMIFVIVLRGPESVLLKNWLLTMVTLPLVLAGSNFTGPSMNPANAFGWAYLSNTHKTLEHFYVYWISPFIGAILAAWIFRVLFPPPVEQKPQKQKRN
ncbi:aquaporin SIP1-2-like [Solanum lycopersicum]|uniref:Small basic intrinsic protein 11 n=1 Tax=Solanum lycopersicum TaxID=4081 RepID=K4DDJ2_SOLLC|nr:aquaporin SIP1-2-like [Solanum lycopersicum]BAO18649.1 small basic intrinsic protein 1;1 [Solanum lycopersicum]